MCSHRNAAALREYQLRFFRDDESDTIEKTYDLRSVGGMYSYDTSLISTFSWSAFLPMGF
ncbi:MAG: hypothetical protein AAF585_04640 [Verrucomicrobiota bacterium]